MSDFPILYADDERFTAWAQIRSESAGKGRRIGSADVWITASARVLSSPLVTNNLKDYRHLDGLEIITRDP